MRQVIQDTLDLLSSPRSSTNQHASALQALEGALARTLLVKLEASDSERVHDFVALQDEFDCNIASRLVPWLHAQTNNMRMMLERTSTFTDKDDVELEFITSNIIQALSILQGVAFLHDRSKTLLGRKPTLEVVLDLLSVYRQATHKPLSNATNSLSNRSLRIDSTQPSLASSVLDTLLCILVDAPSSIRLFEEANGVEVVVKLLKRASNPKDVRMKCLEFLYFYLMDETGGPKQTPRQPSSPIKQATPASSGNYSVTSSGSFSSFDSWAPSFASAPTSTPPQSPTKPKSTPRPRDVSAQCGQLVMLRKEVDFVPLSPKKAQIAGLGVGKRGGPLPQSRLPTRQSLQRKPSPLSRDLSEDMLFSSSETAIYSAQPETSIASAAAGRKDDDFPQVKTTEDKKRILGQLLGNVDALVEGVKSAGIWGLES